MASPQIRERSEHGAASQATRSVVASKRIAAAVISSSVTS
jgi:hypothetical protein